MPELPAPHGLFGVTDPADVAWLHTMLSDMSVLCLLQPVHLDNPAVRAIPRTHIHNTISRTASSIVGSRQFSPTANHRRCGNFRPDTIA